MTIYKLEYEMENGDFDTFQSTDEDEVISEMVSLKGDPQCISATLTELYWYGGMCQGEKVIEEYTK